MAKKKAKATAVSMRPDEMISGGLASDFTGTITEARMTAWDYDGAREHSLFARLTIEPDPDQEVDETVEQHWSAGRLADFIPADEDLEPVDLEADDEDEWDGVCVIASGTKEHLNNNTNWAHFMTALIEAGFPMDEVEGDVRFLEGVRAHFDRIPQKKRSGIVRDEEEEQDTTGVSTILVVTEILESEEEAPAKPKAKKATKKAAKGKATKKDDAEPEVSDEDLLQLIAGIVAEEAMPKADVVKGLMKELRGKKGAAALVKKAGDVDFLSSEEAVEYFAYDADDGHIYPYDED